MKGSTTQSRVADLAATNEKGAVLFEGNLLLYEKGEEKLHQYVTQYDRMEIAFWNSTLLLRSDRQIFNDEPKASNETSLVKEDSISSSTPENSFSQNTSSQEQEKATPPKEETQTNSHSQDSDSVATEESGGFSSVIDLTEEPHGKNSSEDKE
mgnify:FL=1